MMVLYMYVIGVALWQGKAWTSVEPSDTKLNDLCMVRDTGMLFLANEAPKILAYYIPVTLLAFTVT